MNVNNAHSTLTMVLLHRSLLESCSKFAPVPTPPIENDREDNKAEVLLLGFPSPSCSMRSRLASYETWLSLTLHTEALGYCTKDDFYVGTTSFIHSFIHSSMHQCPHIYTSLAGVMPIKDGDGRGGDGDKRSSKWLPLPPRPTAPVRWDNCFRMACGRRWRPLPPPPR